MQTKLIFNEVTQKYEAEYPSVGTTNPFVTESGIQTLSNKMVRASDGTVSLPSISFASDSDNGLYRNGENTLGVSGHLAIAGNLTLTGSFVSGGGVVLSRTITFTEDATSTTHTGTVVIPAGATLHNIQITSSVLWTDAQSVLSVGDAQAATGWFNAVNLAATDLLVGEVLDISNAENWGGKQGAYLNATTGVKGQATATKSGVYYTTAGSVIGVVTMTTPTGTAGRTFMTVTYSVGTVTAATIA